MTVIRNKSFIKVIAIFVAVLFVFQGEYIFAIQQQDQQQVTEGGEKEVDPLIMAFEKGKKQYFEGDFEGAKATFEPLVAQLAEVEGRDILKGEIYLLTGATYEALKYKDPAIKYYCLAKKMLGKGKTVDPLELKELKYYKKDCPSGVVGYAGKRKKKGLGIVGTLLGLAVLAAAGYLLYKYVIKKDDDESNEQENQTGEYSKIEITLKVYFQGGIYSGKDLTRTDTISIDGSQVLKKSNTFGDQCTNYVKKSPEYTIAHSLSSLGTFKLRHQVQLSKPSNWCIKTNWSLTVNYEFEGGRDPGAPIVDFTAPNPSQDNNLDDEVTVTISAPTAKKKGQKVTSQSVSVGSE
jgi:hypothetical protein